MSSLVLLNKLKRPEKFNIRYHIYAALISKKCIERAMYVKQKEVGAFAPDHDSRKHLSHEARSIAIAIRQQFG